MNHIIFFDILIIRLKEYRLRPQKPVRSTAHLAANIIVQSQAAVVEKAPRLINENRRARIANLNLRQPFLHIGEKDVEGNDSLQRASPFHRFTERDHFDLLKLILIDLRNLHAAVLHRRFIPIPCRRVKLRLWYNPFTAVNKQTVRIPDKERVDLWPFGKLLRHR